MHGQDKLLRKFEENNITFVIIKGSAVAMYYLHRTLRPMGDVDILVKNCDLEKAAEVMGRDGFFKP